MPLDADGNIVVQDERVITDEERERFEFLKNTFASGEAALVKLRRVASREYVTVVCGVFEDPETDEFLVHPLAEMLPPNSIDDYVDPTK